ncbi:MAG: DUF3987 domain-containing protein [Deltaproteobacteria bacterium]|nr:DUF3987 domain-containing protein [Deltaproteobacteria bacterium]
MSKSHGDRQFSYDKNKQSTMIENPRLNIMVGTKPGNVFEFFRCKRNIETGLIGRFIPIFITFNNNFHYVSSDRDKVNAKLKYKSFLTLLQAMLNQCISSKK